MSTFKPPVADRVLEYEAMARWGPEMGRDPFAADHPQRQAVFDALDDPECRTIIKQMEDPMTAKELSEGCDVPLSTTYRKLERLTDASLVEEQTELRASGRHTARYAVDFEAIHIDLEEDRSLELTIEQPEQTPERQLSELWAEVRKK